MSKSIIYTANQSVQDVAIDGVFNLGTIIRRFGPNLNLAGNGIQICGGGYYDIDASFTLTPAAAGDLTVTAYLDNVAIPGATATGSAAAAGDYVNLSIDGVVREGCSCCEGLSSLTFVLTGTAASATNIAVKVEKL